MAGYQSEEEMKKAQGGYNREPVVGIPYGYPAPASGQASAGYEYMHPTQTGQPMYAQATMQAPPQQYAVHTNPYQAGMIPPDAVYGPPNGIHLRETFFADTPAPFECSHCGKPGITGVKSSPSLAAFVACMVTMVGVCFLCKGCDCLWHKQHYCQNCGEKVAEFKKDDPCVLMDPTQWQVLSYGLPA